MWRKFRFLNMTNLNLNLSTSAILSSVSHISPGLHRSVSTISGSGMAARKGTLPSVVPRFTLSTPSPPLDSSGSSSTSELASAQKFTIYNRSQSESTKDDESTLTRKESNLELPRGKSSSNRFLINTVNPEFDCICVVR